jgi:hypothetical protein
MNSRAKIPDIFDAFKTISKINKCLNSNDNKKLYLNESYEYTSQCNNSMQPIQENYKYKNYCNSMQPIQENYEYKKRANMPTKYQSDSSDKKSHTYLYVFLTLLFLLVIAGLIYYYMYHLKK